MMYLRICFCLLGFWFQMAFAVAHGQFFCGHFRNNLNGGFCSVHVNPRFNKREAAVTLYASRSESSSPYEKLGDCLLYAYPDISRRKPKAIVQFIGGAFIGAAPEVTYSLFIELLAKEGFLIVAAPYDVTFDHEISSRKIHLKWGESLDMISASGWPAFGLTPSDICDLPIISVGHSNGALMQLLIGSYCIDTKLPKGNVIISFNNKSASDAVPLFDQLGPSLRELTPIVSPFNAFAKYITEEATALLPIGKENVESLRRFVDQIPSVFGEVTDGVSEFRPSPETNRSTIGNLYSVPHNLLVKFSVDTIDETDALEELLKPRVESIGGSVRKLLLNGTHATPLAPDFKIDVGRVYTPADAMNQALRAAALADVKNLVKSISKWFQSTFTQS